MGDMSKEPSMEEILSSIKRIIAEDSQDTGPSIRTGARRAGSESGSERRPRATKAEAILDAIESGELDAIGQDDAGFDDADDDMEVLELTDALDTARVQDVPPVAANSAPPAAPPPATPTAARTPPARPAAPPLAQPARPIQATPRAARPEAAAAPAPASSIVDSDAMLSVATEVAARKALSSLSTMMVKPAGDADNTLENLVRDLLRPILKEWLDANLPEMVQTMVAREIARIAGRTD